MKWAITMGLALGVVLAGCTRQPSPEEVRQKTADTAAALKQDAVAVAQGLRQGLSSEKVDVNHATREQLLALPGMDGEQADRIMVNRPYHQPDDLLRRHLLNREEYERISGRLTAQ